MTTPIFLFSLPRSGSTLLQRLIATSPAVATASETWLLLPQLLGYADEHVYAVYQQRHLHRAFTEFLARIPDGAEAYDEAVRRFADSLYTRACASGQTHFLDKTPRYHLIASRILRCFPEAPAVLLWRHPLAVAASCMNTWCRGRWNLFHYRLDLYHGLTALLEARRELPDRILALRYEDLVAAPEVHLAAVFAHLGLAPQPDAVRRFSAVDLEGSMGDPSGAQRPAITADSATSWPAAFASPLRRLWARRYLDWLGRERLAEMGYDLDASLDALAAEPHRLRRTASDAGRMLYGAYAVRRETALFRRKRALRSRGPGIDVASE